MKTKHEAIRTILSDTQSYGKALNYAIGYCRAGLEIREPSKDLDLQCLYILNNIKYWRHPQAKEVREVLKKKS